MNTTAFNKNNVKTVALLASLGGSLVIAGSALGGRTGMIIGLFLGLAMVGGSYWFSDKLAVRAAGAHPVPPGELTWLQDALASMAARADLQTPRLFISNSPQPNAFATGRNEAHAVVCVTEGLLHILDRREVRGVVAHELGHIKNKDILIGSVAAAIATGITYMAQMAMWANIFGGSGDDDDAPNPVALLLMMLLAPLAATIIQLALSRSREFEADRVGAAIADDSAALASALNKIDAYAKQIPMHGSPSQASAWIINPFGGRNIRFARLFRTHPPTSERVAKLTSTTRSTRRQPT
jgi:heat shock protein HtpX